MPTRRMLVLGLGSSTLLPLTGCTTLGPAPFTGDGSYCYRAGQRPKSRRTCMPVPVPTRVVDAEAKQLMPDPTALTVYILRRRWSDTRHVVDVTVDGGPATATIPESLVRLKLAPGRHHLAITSEGKRAETRVDGALGDVRAVELVGTAWFWDHRFAWQHETVDALRSRVGGSRLVADVDLRH